MHYINTIGTTEILWGAAGAVTINIKDGLVSGSPLNYTFTNPKSTFRTTARGRAIKIDNPDRTGTLAATLEPDTELFDQLQAAFAADLVGVFTVYQSATKRRWTFKNAVIITDLEGGFGSDAPTFTVSWFFENLIYKPGPTNPANVIGV